MRGEYLLQNQTLGASHIVPHPRTLHKAREQVKWMVADGVSRPKIKNYLVRWLLWWLRTSSIWNYQELVDRYIASCWDPAAANMAAGFFQQEATRLRTPVCRLALALSAYGQKNGCQKNGCQKNGSEERAYIF